MKTCTNCRQEKHPSAFHRSRSTNDGLHTHCKACRLPPARRRAAEIRKKPPSSNRTRRPKVYTYHDAGKPCPVFSWAEREGWKPTPVELRPFTAWMKPGVGYVWSDAATARGAVWWFSAREVGGTQRRHTSLEDAVAALERGAKARAA